MATTLEIDSVDKTDIFEFETLQIDNDLSHRSTCSFQVSDQSGVFRPVVGQEVVIEKDSTKIFAGTIDDFDEDDQSGDVIEGIITCVDYNEVTDRKLVPRVYENQTLGAIVADIVSQDLSGEGVTTTNVEAGPSITKVVFNYQTVTQAFDELATLTGYDWYIDYDKDLHFFSRETNVCPVSITNTSVNYRNMRVRTTRDQTRNRQYVRAGNDITDARTEYFAGDGKTKTFTLSYEVAKTPIHIKVNSATKSFGIRGIDENKDFYWNKGSKEIVQDDGGTELEDTDELEIRYQGLFPIIVSSQDDDLIAARAAVEPGTGVYEAIEEDSNIDDRDIATDKANALLRRFGPIPKIVTFETEEEGILAGQLMPITSTRRNLSGNFLIESVTVKPVGYDLVYSIKALDGERLGGWVSFFQKLVESTGKFVIRENEVLVLLRRFSDQLVLGDDLTTTQTTPLRFEIGEMFYDDTGRVAEILS